ncbi:hypothetical protein HPB50_018942 [Hyalomma asiaticum]|uniref:Uncharacterized protein n=1 Tax=Hyalomma asiaticum TaxID=266040 RepID=A0ACB7RRJ7_HYAAI|nr:hypothetical protein HPB50_018942 [Hyalomma asiaticum]
MGATLKDVFVSGKDPSKPGGITMVPKSPYTTQIQWEPPPSLDGTIDVYKVTVCEKSTTCGDREKLTGCVEHEVSETWLDFGSTADTTYCVLVSASSRCGVNVLIGPPAVQEITTPLFELPDVNNLNLVAVDNNYITVAWDQPRDSFDFYWLDVTDGDGNKNGSSGKLRVGTCGNGTIIRPEQTQISCGPFDACSSVSITVHTYSKGPPELVSTGTTLNDIFIGGKEPSEPRSLTMLAESPSTTRFQWERPASLQGTFHGYKVQVCKMFKTCSRKDTLDGCVEYETSASWIDVDTTPDTQYCVVVTAAVRCGRNVLYSAPVTRGVKTPLFALPDVSNLSVAVVKSGYVTLSWQRPRGRFDHYTVEVIEHAVSIASASQKRHGSCASVIIRPDQTELTCGPFEPCTNLSGTIRTHVNGPPDHSSPGASVIGIFIPLEDPSPPTNITMTAESASRTLLQWSPPEENSGVIESYSLKICKTLGQCEKAETLSDCADYVTKETRAVFDSKEDSSYCVLIRATTRCGTEQISSRQATLEIRTPIFDLPSVTNFRLLSAANKSVTVAWERPEVRFDFYWVSISSQDETHHGSNASSLTGSCSNGTIIHPDKTRVTCTNLEACATVNITLRTHRNGPPKHTSDGVSLRNVFIPGEEPDPPRNISIEGKSPSSTRLHWEPPSKAPGRFHGYGVKVCASFDSCSGEASLSNCTELQTHDSWLDFSSSVDTTYCVLVTTISMCGEHVLTGRPAIAEIRTPLLAPEEVSNLKLGTVEADAFTLTWTRPKACFDYYRVEVIDESSGGITDVKCNKGALINPSQDSVSCEQPKVCANVTVRVKVVTRGPPEWSSPGTTLRHILLLGKAPPEVTNVRLATVNGDRFTITLEAPDECLDAFHVRVRADGKPLEEGEGASSSSQLIMDREKPPPYVQYLPGNCTVTLLEEEEKPSPGPPNRTWPSRSAKRRLFYIAVSVCAVVIVACLTAILLVRGQSPPSAEHLEKLDLPDVDNLALLSSTDNSITVIWDRPNVRFDYYWVSISADNGQNITSSNQHHVGSCSNGTIIHASQNRVTCRNIDPCANVSLTVRTHTNGPPERTSTGAAMTGIFTTGPDPDAPTNITAAGISPSLTRLQWSPPANNAGSQTVYTVKVCNNFTSCDKDKYMSGCRENETTRTWLEFQSTIDTMYCIAIVTNAECGPRMLRSPQAVSVITTPSFAPPDVIDVQLIAVGDDFFTVNWTRPNADFDYYLVKVYSIEKDLVWKVGSCANGTIVRPDQTTLTCTNMEPWNLYTFTLRTHITGPPARTSFGTGRLVLTNKTVAPEVSSLRVDNIRANSFVVAWERPKGAIEYYTVEVTDHGSGNIADRHHAIVTCNNGAAINPRQTSLTCTRSDTCTSISVRVRTHTRGPPERASPGVTLEDVLLPGTGMPEVTNLKLITAKNDSFTVEFQAPHDCVDRFHYNITDHYSSRRKVQDKGCTQRRQGNTNIFQVTCVGVESCQKVDFAMGSRKDERDSPGVVLRGIPIRGKCSG